MNRNLHTKTISKHKRTQSQPDVLKPSLASERGYIAQPGPQIPSTPVPVAKKEGGTVSHDTQPRIEFDWEGFGAERVRDFHIDSGVL